MIKNKKAGVLAIILLFLIVALIPVFMPKTQAYAYTDPYAFTIKEFDVTYDINSDRTMHVTELVTIHFEGSESTGFMRDIPVNAGDRVTNAKVYNENGSVADYDVYIEDTDFITLDIGDYSNKTNKTFKYTIEYDYAITKPRDKNAIFLNAVGFGSEATIEQANITLNLPEGLIGAAYYVGKGSTNPNKVEPSRTIFVSVSKLNAYNGVTFELNFEEGVLSTRTDFTPYIVVIVACAVLAALFAVKFLKFNNSRITPVVNFTAPNDIDPLEMGKLIDNTVNNEDVTSLIYYWANKGYLSINLENENDPLLIRLWKKLPDDTPDYQILMFNSLFRYGDEVRVSSLAEKFYGTVETVTRKVNKKHDNLYDKKSIGVSITFAVFGALLMALPTLILPLANISTKLIFLFGFLVFVPAFVVWGLTESLYFKLNKVKKSYKIAALAGIGALSVLFTVLFAFLIPDYIMEFVPKIIAGLIGYAIIMLSVTIVTRTDEYTEQLNQIVGFRNFILYTEKDRLEMLLADNPQLYYNILPYAQVLGVSDIWEKKFEGLTVAPPQWMSNPVETYFSFVILNRAIRASSRSMSTHMRSRPSSSGASGGGGGRFGGGSFGGFGGGGHGGGGFRGR